VQVAFDVRAVSPEYVFSGQFVHAAEPSVSLKVPAVHAPHELPVTR
jgi:hypothetical protein